MGDYRQDVSLFLPLEIAKSFTKRQFHFNTFGGGPMACAIGSAVLEVCAHSHVTSTHFIKGLQDHAHIIRTLSCYISKVRVNY